MTMPADVRALAQEAVELAEKAQPYQLWVMQSTHELAKAFSRHAGTHYATLARALLEALDNHQFMVNRAADEKLDGYRELGARAAAAENDRDALLADLPHVLGRCDCVPLVQNRINVFGNDLWPEAHTAARERVEARIK